MQVEHSFNVILQSVITVTIASSLLNSGAMGMGGSVICLISFPREKKILVKYLFLISPSLLLVNHHISNSEYLKHATVKLSTQSSFIFEMEERRPKIALNQEGIYSTNQQHGERKFTYHHDFCLDYIALERNRVRLYNAGGNMNF